MFNGKFKPTKKLMSLLLVGGITFTLVGCDTELAVKEEYDVVQQNTNGQSEFAGLVQKLDVPGENFKLITEYSCDSSSKREWRITSDKFLFIKAYTENLPEDTTVYIDNVHIDTSIKSKYAVMDGIIQDTMDDRIHNAQMIGFPIGNNTSYYGVNAIEGCNETFIRGTFHGMSGYSNGTITEKRYTESDYMEYGVYANKFQVVYDLLIKGPNDKDFRNVSVKTDFLVNVSSNQIEYEDIHGNVKTKKYTLD